MGSSPLHVRGTGRLATSVQKGAVSPVRKKGTPERYPLHLLKHFEANAAPGSVHPKTIPQRSSREQGPMAPYYLPASKAFQKISNPENDLSPLRLVFLLAAAES